MKLADISGTKKEYLKSKIDELETNGKLKNIRDLYRGISDYKKGYQPIIDIAKDEKSDFVTDCNSILSRRRNHFSQLFNIYGGSYFRQREIHTAGPLVPKSSEFEV